MDHITVRHIVEAVSGTLLCGDADTELKHISIDSRSMRGADLFVPLIGEKSDAHRFLVQAMDNVATLSLTWEHEAAPEGFHGALIQVKDTKLALQTIGRCLRARLSIPLVGITGSVGKTTTREMVAAALSAKYKTFKTPANHNSQIGVPLTISEISENDEIGVLELGMSEPGEMAVIAEIAAVDSAVMTNIGVTHIENLGSRENILKEKLHIQDGMKAGGILFVNGDNDMLSAVVAVLCRARHLVILSDIDGFYDHDPRLYPNAKLIEQIDTIDDSVYALAGGAGSRRGTGGMRTKLQAAALATSQGTDTIVTNGKHPEALYDIVKGLHAGTLFPGKI